MRAVPFEITDPDKIPAKRYYDPEFYARECEHLWPHVWQMACRVEEIPTVGDWVEYKILDKSIIIVRASDGIRAFHNACRHRGVKIASGRGNAKGQGFVCPFHGWRYNLDGKNTFVYGRELFDESQLNESDIGLAPCRFELWAGCVFINFDDEAPPLAECLGSVTEILDARHIDKLKVEWWCSTVVPANWKLAIEAFMEAYHIMRTHPQLQKIMPAGRNEYDSRGEEEAAGASSPKEFIDAIVHYLVELRRGMGGLVDGYEAAIAENLKDMDLPDSVPEAAQAFAYRFNQEITEQGRARGLPVPDLNQVAKSQALNAIYYMFPNFFVLTSFSAMMSYRVRPLGPESCLFEVWSLTLAPEDEEREPPLESTPVAPDDVRIPEITRQDFSNLASQQLGLHNFEYMRLSKKVEGTISNYQRLIDGYIRGASRPELAKASQAVTGYFERPIIDVDV